MKTYATKTCLFCGAPVDEDSRQIVVTKGQVHRRCWEAKTYNERLEILNRLSGIHADGPDDMDEDGHVCDDDCRSYGCKHRN